VVDRQRRTDLTLVAVLVAACVVGAVFVFQLAHIGVSPANLHELTI